MGEELAYQLKSFWITITHFRAPWLADELTSELKEDFTIIKDELNVPLRNTLAIVGAAHNKGNENLTMIHVVCLDSFPTS